jgi:transposase
MKNKAFLGIDVSKGYADFLLLAEDKSILSEAFQLSDNPEGRQKLKELIELWYSDTMEQLYCGVESTGGYESNWYSFLKNLSQTRQLSVARLNARAVKAVTDATLTRTITDEVSAHNIALYLIGYPEKINYQNIHSPVDNKFRDGRQQYTYLIMLHKQKVQLSNQFEKLLYQHFAELLIYCRHGVPGWLLRLLSHYSSARAVVKAGSAKLALIKGISPGKAQSLIQKAGASIQTLSNQNEHLIAVTAMEILHKQDLIDKEKAYLTELYQDDKNVKLLTTIKCIGVQSAIELMLEIEDIDRFELSKKITAYFGVHPKFKQSGDGIWGNHMSKQGRGQVRAILYMASLSGLRYNPILKQLYARYRAKGMKHYQAIGVVMHKLLRIIYGVLKNKQPFNQQVDENNRSRSEEKQRENESLTKQQNKLKKEQKYRYQALSTDAPISRRNAQKRKKQTAS